MPALQALVAALALLQPDSTIVKTPADLRVVVPRTAEVPVLDGRLDDAIWARAARLEDFVQFEPGDQVAPSQPTVGYVAYDAEYLYFAFRAWEANRGDVRATVFPRERGGDNDDRVALLLDTFRDNRRAYQLEVTPYGIQGDAIRTEGSGSDESVDFVWRSAGRVLDDGWAVEIAIPFASLRFPGGDTLAVGFNAIRVFGRTGEQAAWAPRRRGSPCDICQQGVLLGIADVDRGRTVDVVPYVAAVQYGARGFGRDSALVDGAYHATRPPLGFTSADPTARAGADVRLALTSSLVLNATVNPDFSQVESDAEQIRTNQRFALFLDERRPFFLEGRDVFSIQSTARAGVGSIFYSRAIVDPAAGARITGKQGPYTVGALYARDDAPAYFHYDGYESGGVVERIGAPADVVVARVRRDVLADSYVALTTLGRDAGASRFGLLGADAALRAGAITVTAEAGLSHDRAPLAVGADTVVVGPDTAIVADTSEALDGRERGGAYYRLGVSRTGPALSWSIGTAGATPEFRNQLGRFSRMGIQEHSASVALRQYPNGRWLQRVEEELNVRATSVFGGRILDAVASPQLSVELARRTDARVGPYFERVTLEGNEIDLVGYMVEVETDAWKRLSLGVDLFAGEREIYDGPDSREGDGYFGSVRVELRPTEHSSLELRGQRSTHYERWGGELVDDAKILRLRGIYQVTRALGVRVIGELSDQFDSNRDNPTARHVVRLGSSALVTYELAPASFLYVGYNDAYQDFESPVVPRPRRLRTGSQLFFKVSYLVRL